MPRCLITGASGFIGFNLVAHMEHAGWAVRCLVRPTSQTESLTSRGVELMVGSLADLPSLQRAVAGMDVVFHLAGRLQALRHADFQQDNVVGTHQLTKACANLSQPPVMVIVSSLAAGGPATEQAPRIETDTDFPVSNYGRSKQAAEQAAASWASEVPISIVRPPIVFGPADHDGLKLFQSVKRFHLHLVPAFHKFHVSIIHVGDLCNALLRVASHGSRIVPVTHSKTRTIADVATGTYYATTERVLEYQEMGRLAAQAIDTRTLVLPLPKIAFWTVGALSEVLGQLTRRPGYLNLDKMREATAPSWVCSDEKIRRELDYQPTTPLVQQFAETARWYEAHKWL
jgi:nucleoside-diphosphate-sugar epimerase